MASAFISTRAPWSMGVYGLLFTCESVQPQLQVGSGWNPEHFSFDMVSAPAPVLMATRVKNIRDICSL